MPRPARAVAGRGAALAGLVALAACAKVAPPPGGPEDRDAPTIVADAVRPVPRSAGVPHDAPVTILFSEAMDRRSVLRSLAVFPPVDFRATSWHRDTLRLEPDPGWAPERSTILRIGTGARDRRGNALASGWVLRFTTKATADSGVLRGRVWPGREKTQTAALLVFALPADSVRDGTEPVALAEPAADGAFALDGLDPAAAWRVAALIDRDGDARPGGRDEAWTVRDPIAFPPDSSVAVVPDFLVGTLDSLGRVRGEVKADSGAVVVVEARTAVDGAVRATVTREGGGAFTLEAPTGAIYRVAAFVDLDGDGVRSAEEPAVEAAGDVRLDLAAERSGLALDLRGKVPPAAPAPAPADTSAGGTGGGGP